MIKEELSDEDLLTLCEAGSKSAEDALYQRYYELSVTAGRNYARLYANLGITEQEYTAVAFSKVFDALRTYKRVRVDFKSYWRVLVHNAVNDYINENVDITSVRRPGNISLDERAYNCDEELLLSDIIGGTDDYLNGDSLYRLLNVVFSSDLYGFTKEEREVGKYIFILGYKRAELVDILDMDEDHLNYVIRNLKKKLMEIIQESYL